MTATTDSTIVKCYKSDWQNEASQQHEFEAWDQTKTHGSRRIGAKIWTFEIEFTPAPADDRRGWHNRVPGRYFGLLVSATRNGEPYGASQSERYFKTDGERDKAIAKYLKGARKRAEG